LTTLSPAIRRDGVVPNDEEPSTVEQRATRILAELGYEPEPMCPSGPVTARPAKIR
jgi:hypothetical protein